MKSANIFSRVFVVTALTTAGLLAFTSYASKKALAADPDLLNRLQSKYNVKISGFGVTPSQDVTKDSWNLSGPIQKIKLATVSGDLRVAMSDSDALLIEAEGNLSEDAAEGARLLKIKTEDGSVSISDGRDVSNLSLMLKVPKNTQSLILNTVSGDVMLKNISVKEFGFNSVSGDLRAENVHFEAVRGGTVSGDVEISSNDPTEVKFESISGDIKLKLPTVQKSKFTLKSVSGEIQNSHPSTEGPHEVMVKTTSGDIEIE